MKSSKENLIEQLKLALSAEQCTTSALYDQNGKLQGQVAALKTVLELYVRKELKI